MSQLSDGQPIGVVGDHPAVGPAVEAAGGEVHAGAPAAVLAQSPEAVVAVGERALFDLVAAAADVPVLPVAAGRGVRSVPTRAVERAVSQLVAGAFERVTLPVLAARGDALTARALTDLMLVTEEAARISEYAVWTGDEHVATFRADGIVVATPAGSGGYARAAGGPVLAPDTGVVSVVPVAPFATDASHWVLPHDDLHLRVERDETPVELLADGRRAGLVTHRETVRIAPDGTLTLAVTDASAAHFPPE
jgi:NAD+ kinase